MGQGQNNFNFFLGNAENILTEMIKISLTSGQEAILEEIRNTLPKSSSHFHQIKVAAKPEPEVSQCLEMPICINRLYRK